MDFDRRVIVVRHAKDDKDGCDAASQLGRRSAYLGIEHAACLNDGFGASRWMAVQGRSVTVADRPITVGLGR